MLDQLLISDLHCSIEPFCFVSLFVPPHWVDSPNPIPYGTVNRVVALTLAYLHSIVVCIDGQNEAFIDFIANLLFDVGVDHRLEGKLGLTEDGFDDVGDDFLKLKINESCRGQFDLEVGVSARELSLMMIEVFGRLVLATNINNNVAFLQLFVVPTSEDLSPRELVGVFGQHDTGQDFVAVEGAVVSPNFKLLLHR